VVPTGTSERALIVGLVKTLFVAPVSHKALVEWAGYIGLGGFAGSKALKTMTSVLILDAIPLYLIVKA
jgi:hypothetical protein